MRHPVLTQEWREAHVRLGDKALEVAQNVITDNVGPASGRVPEGAAIVASAFAAVAQAHYAAANVRARPATQ